MSNADVIVRLSLENKQLSSELAKTERRYKASMKRMEKDTQSFGASVASSMRGLAIGAAAAAGVIAFTRAIKGAVDAADEMGKVAQKIGVSTEALSALEFAAGQAGVEFEVLQKALAKVAVDMSKNGSLFKSLGIDAKTADEALVKLATVFKGMPDGLEKTALAAKIFGERIGPGLIPLLNQGEDGITRLTGDEVKRSMDGVFLKVANDLLPEMQKMADWMASPDTSNKISSFATVMSRLTMALVGIGGAISEKVELAGDSLNVLVNGELFATEALLNNRIKNVERLQDVYEGATEKQKEIWANQIATYRKQLADLKAEELRVGQQARIDAYNKSVQGPSTKLPKSPDDAAKAAAEAAAKAAREAAAKSGRDAGKAYADGMAEALRAEENRVNAFEKLLDLEAEGDAIQEAVRTYAKGVQELVELAKDAMLSMDDPRIVALSEKLKGKLDEVINRQDETFKAQIDHVEEMANAFNEAQKAFDEKKLETIGNHINALFGAMAQGSDAGLD